MRSNSREVTELTVISQHIIWHQFAQCLFPQCFYIYIEVLGGQVKMYTEYQFYHQGLRKFQIQNGYLNKEHSNGQFKRTQFPWSSLRSFTSISYQGTTLEAGFPTYPKKL